ncbi:hypothetical protein GF339_15270 [candidate division KSB3 bacterium]|uniref:Thioredoxin domain-containing protein n=1 Tax=candidate division KSB3 bacterium TaxID=2044937 RepID=A0A9D5JYB1_9BACT|nr:hypothetical protein [candidate division KSB3 bacterium]MBD3325946.1 hypothetical protein [candidate division KSB3 bacterium]
MTHKVGKSVLVVTMMLIPAMMLTLTVALQATAVDHPILYLFWGDGCPHCEEEKEFLTILQKDYPEFEMRWFEVWDHPEFAKVADALRKTYDIKTASVPMTFLGEWAHVGFRSFDSTGAQIAEQVEACLQHGCPDALDRIGPLQIARQIRDQAAKQQPQEWQQFPATTFSQQ